MSIDDDIEAAWRRFYGNLYPKIDSYIPNTPDDYKQGYRDGRASVAAEIAEALSLFDYLASVWGDEGVFRTARDRLRALL